MGASATAAPSNCHPLNFGYMGPNATTGFPITLISLCIIPSLFKKVVACLVTKASRWDIRCRWEAEAEDLSSRCRCRYQWVGSSRWEECLCNGREGKCTMGMAYPPPGYGYPSMMPPQQQPYQYDPAYAAHRQAGDYTTNNHSAPGPEYGHQQ